MFDDPAYVDFDDFFRGNHPDYLGMVARTAEARRRYKRFGSETTSGDNPRNDKGQYSGVRSGGGWAYLAQPRQYTGQWVKKTNWTRNQPASRMKVIKATPPIRPKLLTTVKKRMFIIIIIIIINIISISRIKKEGSKI